MSPSRFFKVSFNAEFDFDEKMKDGFFKFGDSDDYRKRGLFRGSYQNSIFLKFSGLEAYNYSCLKMLFLFRNFAQIVLKNSFPLILQFFFKEI